MTLKFLMYIMSVAIFKISFNLGCEEIRTGNGDIRWECDAEKAKNGNGSGLVVGGIFIAILLTFLMIPLCWLFFKEWNNKPIKTISGSLDEKEIKQIIQV